MKDIYVVGAILIRDGKILCAQRGGEKSLAYKWEFPGGKIEAGETPQEALHRELTEELFIDIPVTNDIFDTTSYSYDFGRVHLTTIICPLAQEMTPVLTEHAAIEWLEPSQLTKLDWAPADQPAVAKLSSMHFE
ncbi:(deoxy)nucleoside triphosphate pyrophosphohydrolase [Aerococcus sp. 1KP-2016]|jgi:8-oxo-dGTP diphosphatase|uniref:(deoxy)nucleoside triphosphate pyrophosphohydrolase n=1 Tax=Aerococcus sp. 1KP-2016 TaxID=1981982 RepID=UPI000B98A9AC|nr:(deoxy)nucleoside triphosphate pyrophosphohydrolase [Aerococcus sp. 1KP-2016]OYQ65621.1 DNA mismatch repair protein MutT [Aerococcus sp. 1KP-2016]